MSKPVTQNNSTYHPLNPIGLVKNHSYVATTFLLLGGLSAAVYLAYTNRFFPGVQYYPERLQAAVLTTPQFLATCIANKGQPRDLKGALSVFNCYSIKDQTFNAFAKTNDQTTFYCQTLKKTFRSSALLINPDKCKITSDKELFNQAQTILNGAKDWIHQRFCTSDAKIAQCVVAAPSPFTESAAKEVLKCAGEEIPSTCGYLQTFARELADKVNKARPEQTDLIRKIERAYNKISCYPVPSSIVNWWFSKAE